MKEMLSLLNQTIGATKYLFFARIYDKMWSSVLYLDRKSNDSRNEFIIIASKTS